MDVARSNCFDAYMHLRKFMLLLLVFCESNFGQSICKKSTLQSAGGHNAQYKGETNDPVKHENAKGRKVSEIRDPIFHP